MPRFHFHNEDGRCYPDEDGIELPDMAAVQRTALRVLTEMICVHEQDVWATRGWRLTVTDESGLSLLVIDLSISGSAAFPLSLHRTSEGQATA